MKPIAIISLILSFGLLAETTMALEEPLFEIVESHDAYEVRLYEPYLVAEVDVSGDLDGAGNEAFRILAGYIFGDNSASEKMKMTAPVASRPAGPSQKMSMTAPVTSTTSEGVTGTTYAFVMERRFTEKTLPTPTNDRIRIRTVAKRHMAVRRYSGRWTQDKYVQNREILLKALASKEIPTIGEPILARYNSPFSLPVMRRNEVMIEIDNSKIDNQTNF